MRAEKSIEIPHAYQVVVTLAELLQRLESSAERSSADQYRAVVRHLSTELETVQPGPELEAILQAFPAAGELYENLRYEQAGLCRSPLELSLNTEMQARREIERIAGLAA